MIGSDECFNNYGARINQFVSNVVCWLGTVLTTVLIFYLLANRKEKYRISLKCCVLLQYFLIFYLLANWKEKYRISLISMYRNREIPQKTSYHMNFAPSPPSPQPVKSHVVLWYCEGRDHPAASDLLRSGSDDDYKEVIRWLIIIQTVFVLALVVAWTVLLRIRVIHPRPSQFVILYIHCNFVSTK